MENYPKFTQINYDEAVKLVYNTKDDVKYLNRTINENSVKRLMKSLSSPLSLSTMSPITVNANNNHIVDGQHRLNAFIRLVENKIIPYESKLNVLFIKLDNLEEEDQIIERNITARNWVGNDYTRFESERGNEVLKKFSEFAEKHKEICYNRSGRISHRVVALFLNYSLAKHKLTPSEIREYYETHPITDEMLAEGDKMVEQVSKIFNILKLKWEIVTLEAMIPTWRRVRDLNSLDKWYTLARKRYGRGAFRGDLDNLSTKGGWNKIFSLISTYGK